MTLPANTKSSKELILQALRQNRPAATELPPLAHTWTTYPDRPAQFLATLESIGATGFIARDANEMNQRLSTLPQYTAANKIVSLVDGVGTANVDLAAADSPHTLADVDLAILPGDFGVAENAAVWVTDKQIPLRVIYFLCQHLVLVLPVSEIVDHMHAAYERLKFAEPAFGVFIAGPSKTADIEQSLVIGAHGPRSLTVFLVSE